jgi:hypothetical protein
MSSKRLRIPNIGAEPDGAHIDCGADLFVGHE